VMRIISHFPFSLREMRGLPGSALAYASRSPANPPASRYKLKTTLISGAAPGQRMMNQSQIADWGDNPPRKRAFSPSIKMFTDGEARLFVEHAVAERVLGARPLHNCAGHPHIERKLSSIRSRHRSICATLKDCTRMANHDSRLDDRRAAGFCYRPQLSPSSFRSIELAAPCRSRGPPDRGGRRKRIAEHGEKSVPIGSPCERFPDLPASATHTSHSIGAT